MSNFTDDDLKRLKEHPEFMECTCTSPEKHKRKTGGDVLPALLARLEAAENRQCAHTTCEHKTCNAWRKAAGK